MKIILQLNIIILLFMAVLPTDINAQELKLKSFMCLENNTTARVNRKRDVNGQNCAVLIIKHNFKKFKIESGKGYEALDEKIGETWVWLSPDDYRIVIRKEGYIPFEYNLKGMIKSLETYEMILSDGYGNINIIAPHSKIWIDDKLVGNDSCSFSFKEGQYIIKVTRHNYYEKQKLLVVKPGENIDYKFQLKPKMGNLIITSTPLETVGANIIIDDSLYTQKTNTEIPLMIGWYKVRVEKYGFANYEELTWIKENDNTIIVATLNKNPLLSEIESIKKRRRRMRVFFGSYIVGGLISIKVGNSIESEDDPNNWNIAGIVLLTIGPLMGIYSEVQSHKELKRARIRYSVVITEKQKGIAFNYSF